MATAVVKGDSFRMTSILIKNANAVATLASKPNHSQSDVGTVQKSNERPFGCNRKTTARTAAALNSSNRVKFDASYCLTKTELSVLKTPAKKADTKASETPQ